MSKKYRQLCWTCQNCDSCNKCEFVSNLNRFSMEQKKKGNVTVHKNGYREHVPPTKEQLQRLYIPGTITDSDGYITHCPKYKEDPRPNTLKDAVKKGYITNKEIRKKRKKHDKSRQQKN